MTITVPGRYTRLDIIAKKSAEWHRKRRETIGSSDSKIIMTGTADELLRLWREKRGETEPDDLIRVIPVLIGNMTEPLNLALFERETGFTITRDGEQLTGQQFPFMGCTLDGFCPDHNAIVECKHVGGFEPRETVVARYMPQSHHLAAVAGTERVYLSVISGTNEYWYQEIIPDPFYTAELIEREAAFWKCVQDGTPPAPLPAVTPPVPPEQMRVVDMTRSNAWMDSEHTWLMNRDSAAAFDKAQAELKALVEPDVGRAYGKRVEVNRDKRGALRFKERKT